MILGFLPWVLRPCLRLVFSVLNYSDAMELLRAAAAASLARNPEDGCEELARKTD